MNPNLPAQGPGYEEIEMANMSRRNILRGSLAVLGAAAVPNVFNILKAESAEAAELTNVSIERVAGTDRIGTAIEICKEGWAPGTASTVVLACSEKAPDALCGGPVAAAVGEAPLLLNEGARLNEKVWQEVQRVRKAGNQPPFGIILMGGTAALSAQVEQDLLNRGIRREGLIRIAGVDRFATSVSAAEGSFYHPRYILLADGSLNNFSDALIAGAAGAGYYRPDLSKNENSPVILTNGALLTQHAKDYIAREPDAIVVGVGAQASRSYPVDMALTGRTPGELSVKVAKAFPSYAQQQAMPGTVGSNGEGLIILASWEKFPDGLAAGARAGRNMGGNVLLTSANTLDVYVEQFLRENKATIKNIIIAGGTSAISESVEQKVRGIFPNAA